MTRYAWAPTRALALLLVLLGAAGARAEEPVRLHVELGGTIGNPSWFVLSDPDRLVVDLPGGRARSSRHEGTGPVKRVRLAQFDPATARVVIELAAPQRILDARIDPAGGGVTLLLAPTTVEDFTALPRLGRFSAERRAAEPPPLTTAEANAGELAALDQAAAPPVRGTRAQRPLIMLDPGHGGHDVGAISVFEGRFEKDATLAIAQAVKREIERSGRFRVVLTRDDDRFIELGERVAIARRAGASLFLSIHCDSAPSAEAHGATVYTLSDAASDRMAARAAARENQADLAGVTDPRREDEPAVSTILYDLTRRSAMNGSASFAETLDRAMPPEVAFTGAYHRFAGFRVLKTADMPAALLETGYVTNEADARFLFSPEGERAIARGVRAALERYFAPRTAFAQAGVEGRGGTR